MAQNDIEKRLSEFIDPFTGKDLVTSKSVKVLNVNDDSIHLEIALGYPLGGVGEQIGQALSTWLSPSIGDRQLNLRLTSRIDAHVGKQGIKALPNIKNIIAVASGKGGVGKSTVAVNVALALAKDGASVGILDADIYGPSQPTMLDTVNAKPAIKDNVFQPVESHGIKSMSIGYLVDGAAPLAWRGPMIGKAMQQMLNDTNWGELDYLVVDLPPGTGDIQLSLCQKAPISGALIVTTPQDIALVDVKRACEMFNKLEVPILGVVENMSVYQCSNCGHQEHIFGQGAAEKIAQEYQLEILGDIPLNAAIREETDSGKPPVEKDPKSDYALQFRDLAINLAGRLSLLPKDFSSRFPNVVVKNDD